jgi:CelD/BcsL family acetyltransferase involved in cellulose biosynthesis
MPLRQLGSASNEHSGRFDLLAERPREASAAFLAHLAEDRSWDLLRITHLTEGGAAWALLEASERAGLPAGVWHSGRSPYVKLPATLEALAAAKRKNRKTLRRKRRRLEERGKVTLERVEGGEALDLWLEEGFRIERSGWKAKNGTAVSQDPRTLGFYTQLAHRAAAEGQLALYFLKLDGQPIAFQFGLSYGGRYLAMKPGYDEAYADVSPGQLLTESLIEDCVRRGIRELDLLGDDTVSKREWTDRARRHGWLFVFRDSLIGRALCSAKFRLVPAARRMVRRWARPH